MDSEKQISRKGRTNEMKAIDLIKEERNRQINSEGFDYLHDDEHTNFELADAAAAYAQHGHESQPPASWPWEREWWKPSQDNIRNLVKAGALIVAEIERLQRMK